jgi:membrane protein implicated in regulation of membrane protease activity
LLEALADFGAVSILGVDTFTTAIYKTWFGLYSLPAAAQLSCVLLLAVAAVLLVEQALRSRGRVSERSLRPMPRLVLRGWRAVAALRLHLGRVRVRIRDPGGATAALGAAGAACVAAAGRGGVQHLDAGRGRGRRGAGDRLRAGGHGAPCAARRLAARSDLPGQSRALGARMVDFGGWDMPVHYGSQIEEHHAVRRNAGLFDVSHMCVVDLRGPHARAFLQRPARQRRRKLKLPGKALYSCMLNERGGVLDDLIVYFRAESGFRLVVNAGTRDKDLAWIRAGAGLGRNLPRQRLEVIERSDLAMIAVQGPQARELLAAQLLPRPSARRHARARAVLRARRRAAAAGAWFVARTGYTGEDGFEVMLPAARGGEGLWRALNAAGVPPAGSARATRCGSRPA